MRAGYYKTGLPTLVAMFAFLPCISSLSQDNPKPVPIRFENLSNERWVSEIPTSLRRVGKDTEITVKVWFDRQLLGDGKAYLRRAAEFDAIPRSVLSSRCIDELKRESDASFFRAKKTLDQLKASGILSDIRQHWIVNGFSATTRVSDIQSVKEIPGVSKIFIVRKSNPTKTAAPISRTEKNSLELAFDPERWLHPWYTRALKADQVWKKLGITGRGTLNVIHDFHFAKSPQMAKSQSPIVGFNFNQGDMELCVRPESVSPRDLHGVMCAAIVCGRGSPEFRYEFGLAPLGEWAGVIARSEIESSVEWAIENGADTYSMSFSIPGLDEYRSHWRKILEHGTICGLCFVSGAGNFAKTVKTPRQMRTPEDIPQVVFAAAGVHRDLSKTSFSSQGPVLWQTDHYHDGKVKKPEVCAFNHQLPVFFADGTVRESAINGNSFAGPMFCGAIALMRSADKEIHPWRIREIITTTATDIGPPGFDPSTGYGLINCYQAVKEVLKRKAIREGSDPTRFEKNGDDGSFNSKRYLAELSAALIVENSVQNVQGANLNILRVGDIITAVGEDQVTSLAALNAGTAKNRGKSINVHVIRNGKAIQVRLQPEAFTKYKIRQVYSAPVFK